MSSLGFAWKEMEVASSVTARCTRGSAGCLVAGAVWLALRRISSLGFASSVTARCTRGSASCLVAGGRLACVRSFHTRLSKPGLYANGDLDDFLTNGVLHQLRLIVDVQLTHEIKLVGFDGLYTQGERAGYFLDRVSLRQKL